MVDLTNAANYFAVKTLAEANKRLAANIINYERSQRSGMLDLTELPEPGDDVDTIDDFFRGID